MPMTDIASGALAGSFLPTVLLAGESEITNNAAPSLVAALAKYEIAALTATGVTTYVTGTHTPDMAVIVMQPITAVGQQVPFVEAGGKWNHAMLTWPAAQSTYPTRLAFAQATKWAIGKVLMQGNPVWAS